MELTSIWTEKWHPFLSLSAVQPFYDWWRCVRNLTSYPLISHWKHAISKYLSTQFKADCNNVAALNSNYVATRSVSNYNIDPFLGREVLESGIDGCFKILLFHRNWGCWWIFTEFWQNQWNVVTILSLCHKTCTKNWKKTWRKKEFVLKGEQRVFLENISIISLHKCSLFRKNNFFLKENEKVEPISFWLFLTSE